MDLHSPPRHACSVFVVLALCGVLSASAQAPGLPLRMAPSHPSGLSIHATRAWGADGAEPRKGLGLAAGLARGKWHWGAQLGRVDARDSGSDLATTWGASLGYRLTHRLSPAVSSAARLGLGRAVLARPGRHHTQLNIPLAVGFASRLPTPAGNIEPWLAPRAQLRRTTDATGAITSVKTALGGGASFGLEWTCTCGIGVHGSGDVLRIASPHGTGTRSEWFWGIGLHYQRMLP